MAATRRGAQPAEPDGGRRDAFSQEDDPPYIESLGDHWGELCATQELALAWSNQLLPP